MSEILGLEEALTKAECRDGKMLAHRQPIPEISVVADKLYDSANYSYLCCDSRDCVYKNTSENIMYCTFDKKTKQ